MTESGKIITFFQLNSTNFQDNFVREKVKKMASKAKTLNICALEPNWKWIHDDVILSRKIIIRTMQFQILINIGHINLIPANTKTSQRRRKNILFLVSKTS